LYRIGHGIDIHKLQAGHKLVLGGVEIPHKEGLVGHSDADVVLHALCDALLGAAALGDLGTHFPMDAKNKGRSSLEILGETAQLVWDAGWHVVNVDCTLLAEVPKIVPHRDKMRENIARTLNMETPSVSMKATTNEGLGFVGRREGMECHAVVMLKRRES